MLQREHSGDGCDLVSTLCKYELRKDDLLFPSWARVRRVRRGNIYSELIICAQHFVISSCGKMPSENRCVYMAHVCFYVCCNDCMGVCGNVGCVSGVVKDSVFSLGMLKYVVCLCRGCDVFCLNFETWSCRCSCMRSVSVSSCRCCIFVHPVAVLNVA